MENNVKVSKQKRLCGLPSSYPCGQGWGDNLLLRDSFHPEQRPDKCLRRADERAEAVVPVIGMCSE